MPDLPDDLLSDLDEKDWQAINRIGEELAEENAKAQDVEKKDEQQAKPPEDSTEQEETPKTEEEAAKPYISFNSKKEFQDAIDERLNSRIERERNKASKDREKAEREARNKALEEQQNFEELYKSEQQRVADLEEELTPLRDLTETHETYKSTVEEIAKARMEALNLPKGVATLVEGMDPADRLSWLQENESDFSGSTETVPPSPNGDDTFSSPEADNKARAEFAHQEASKF